MANSALLLDSNVVVWFDKKSIRLPDWAMNQIVTAPQVFVSAVTAWELAIKQSLGSLSLSRPVSHLIQAAGMIELPVTVRHGEAVQSLPFHHRDPFDRLLVVQAQMEGLVLVTGDRRLALYGIPVVQV
ncbi:MAG TPA: type II toxin-antitoxin system VapC family toxin [Terracidiphilus sp.]|nr:type II toxin-antitoxin system VapC family toxin [Terracidiphilus sp.]